MQCGGLCNNLPLCFHNSVSMLYTALAAAGGCGPQSIAFQETAVLMCQCLCAPHMQVGQGIIDLKHEPPTAATTPARAPTGELCEVHLVTEHG